MVRPSGCKRWPAFMGTDDKAPLNAKDVPGRTIFELQRQLQQHLRVMEKKWLSRVFNKRYFPKGPDATSIVDLNVFLFFEVKFLLSN
jgi:hypothetical protein